MASLKIAASCIDGLILKPGETFSFWRLVGKPTARRGFKMGLVLRNGTMAQDIGGGLCQMTNLIYWMTIHTELAIVERWRHGFDVFPDAGRTQPFASGATCSYNYIDLQISNRTADTYQLGSGWRATSCAANGGAERAALHASRLSRRDHAIRHRMVGRLFAATTSLWRIARDAVTGAARARNSSPRITPS